MEGERYKVQGKRVINIGKYGHGHGQRHGHGCLVKHIASGLNAYYTSPYGLFSACRFTLYLLLNTKWFYSRFYINISVFLYENQSFRYF